MLAYLEEYREIILKLEGIDEFQKTRGFIRGLDKACKKEVKRSSPKTLEEAIKFALINEGSTRPGTLTLVQLIRSPRLRNMRPLNL